MSRLTIGWLSIFRNLVIDFAVEWWECCCMWLLLVRQQGRIDSLRLVRLVNDVSDSVYSKLRDPPLVFPFPFCCFGWWTFCVQCQTCGYSWKMGGRLQVVFDVGGVWMVRRVHTKLSTICSIFNLYLCVYVLAGWQVSQCRLWCMQRSRVWPRTRAPLDNLFCTQNSTFLLTLHQHYSTHSSTCDWCGDWVFSQRPRHERMAFIEDDQFLAFLFLLSTWSKEKGPLYIV